MLFITQRKYYSYSGLFFWFPVAFVLLLLPGCSPLQIVNKLSAESDSVSVIHQRYGGEQRQQLDIFMPERIVPGSPAVLFFYGGSWKRGQKGKYGFVGHTLGSKGFVTVIPDYRLYPEVTFPSFVEDGAKALAWVRENVGQARHGVVVMGHSAGAHIAALLALDQEYLSATGQPLSIVRGMIGLAGPYGFNPMKYRSTRPIFTNVGSIEKAMPVTFACSAKLPILLIHGADDGVVIPENSRELKRRVYECAGNVEYLELDDIGHFSIVLGLSNSLFADDAIQSSIEVFLKTLSHQSG
jgi:acetyl esterase/lipase